MVVAWKISLRIEEKNILPLLFKATFPSHSWNNTFQVNDSKHLLLSQGQILIINVLFLDHGFHFHMKTSLNSDKTIFHFSHKTS